MLSLFASNELLCQSLLYFCHWNLRLETEQNKRTSPLLSKSIMLVTLWLLLQTEAPLCLLGLLFWNRPLPVPTINHAIMPFSYSYSNFQWNLKILHAFAVVGQSRNLKWDAKNNEFNKTSGHLKTLAKFTMAFHSLRCVYDHSKDLYISWLKTTQKARLWAKRLSSFPDLDMDPFESIC